MGLSQTKLHWCVLEQDWTACLKRIETKPAEVRTFNPYADLPLHLAVYTGQAPPAVIRSMIDSYPESVNLPNKAGRTPLELAAINYRVGGPYRAEVLALLRWHRLDNSRASNASDDTAGLEGLFSSQPPNQMFSTSCQCIICCEEEATVALIPCGHICLCTKCVRTAMRPGLCPVDRREVKGLYRLQGDQLVVHKSMCLEENGEIELPSIVGNNTTNFENTENSALRASS